MSGSKSTFYVKVHPEMVDQAVKGKVPGAREVQEKLAHLPEQRVVIIDRDGNPNFPAKVPGSKNRPVVVVGATLRTCEEIQANKLRQAGYTNVRVDPGMSIDMGQN